MDNRPLRHKIYRRHPVIIYGPKGTYRLLNDHETVQDGDETCTVSTLLSFEGDTWHPVNCDELQDMIGQTVKTLCDPDMSEDADCCDRIFRRH